MVHHVAFCSETLSAFLGALEGANILVHAHMYGQIVSVAERFLAGGHGADEICPGLMVGQMGSKVLL